MFDQTSRSSHREVQMFPATVPTINTSALSERHFWKTFVLTRTLTNVRSSPIDRGDNRQRSHSRGAQLLPAEGENGLVLTKGTNRGAHQAVKTVAKTALENCFQFSACCRGFLTSTALSSSPGRLTVCVSCVCVCVRVTLASR